MNATAKITLQAFRTSPAGAASALRDTARIYGVESADMAVSKELKNARMIAFHWKNCANNWQVSTNTQQNILMHSMQPGASYKALCVALVDMRQDDRSRCSSDRTYTG